jgi:hypothetical protein
MEDAQTNYDRARLNRERYCSAYNDQKLWKAQDALDEAKKRSKVWLRPKNNRQHL